MISVIIPVYNGENTINRCVDSVLAQTCTDTQIIIINDESTDNTGAICEKYAAKYTNIIYRAIDNNGVSNARNVGLSLASGDYVYFLDADDYLEPDTLALMESAARRGYPDENDSYDMVLSGFIRENYIGNAPDYKLTGTHYYVPGDYSLTNDMSWNEHFCSLYQGSFINYVWGKLYKREILVKFNLKFDTTIWYGEDVIFNVDFLRHSKSIITVADALYHYVCTETPSLSKKFDMAKYSTRERLFADVTDMAAEKHITKNTYAFAKMYFKSVYNMLQQMADAGISNGDIRKYIKKLLVLPATKSSRKESFNRDMEFNYFLFPMKLCSPFLILFFTKFRKKLRH